jgi:hypothetical protein
MLTEFEQQALAKMSTALQALSDDEFTFAAVNRACRDAIGFDRLASKAVADERYRRELGNAEAAKELTE